MLLHLIYVLNVEGKCGEFVLVNTNVIGVDIELVIRTEVEIKLKQFVIIPKKPKMSVGKIASQTAHATFMALEGQDKQLINEWKESGMCVVVLECKDTLQLMGIATYFKQWSIPHHLYIDEGLTEVEMGTPTALATGILREDKHWILSQLKLKK